MKNYNTIGVDVGGSHVSVTNIDTNQQGKTFLELIRKNIDAKDSAYEIVVNISDCIKEILHDKATVESVGIAFPGPFDYEKGVCAIANVGGKFENMFGIHMQQAMADFTGLTNAFFVFSNDAHCFAEGVYHRYQLESRKTVFLTLGTGFGSAFMENGVLLTQHPQLPAIGAFYDEPFLDAKADDCFSTRWFLSEYKKQTGKEIASVKEMIAADAEIAGSIFNQFGINLATFLFPWLQQFECDELIIGGNIAKASSLFEKSLKDGLAQMRQPINVVFCEDTEECILTGAAVIAERKNNMNKQNTNFLERKTTQPVLPVNAVESGNGYTIFPSFHSEFLVFTGFDALAQKICNEKTVVIDGFNGVLWENFRTHLHTELQKRNKKVFWYDVNTCLKTTEEIDAMISDNLKGNDPVFGKRYMGSLSDFFDKEKLEMLQPDASADLCILYGTGAALGNWDSHLVYVDVPKNEIQYRMRAGSVKNIGAVDLFDNAQMYKRAYFVEWPVLNKHKEELLSEIDSIVDEQRIHEITWMEGGDFRNTLTKMLEQPLRARPWFEAGVWGGNWMKKNIKGLNMDEVNYAWSFELITPENGIVIEGNQNLLEVSFDFLLFHNNTKLLGKAAQRFGTEFPIRFDFLDTFDGGNLSIQCHPRTAYIQENFGENFTQDETYYILDCEPGADVYLGFQEDINPVEFKSALLDAQNNGIEMQAEKYVQKFKANKHDLFLIPNGTIHASGKNNMVLEISSTPYIFTFKMYDWLRLGLNGQPRPINIEHAFENLYFERKGKMVQETLISQPTLIAEGRNYKQFQLPTHPEHFYAIERFEFTDEINVNTNNQCHICMLVEGNKVEVSVENKTDVFNYAETFVIPAATNKYSVKNNSVKKAMLVIAYVKDECC
ncbi:ROK family protein [Solitalea koreensis]|uniref:fructokinase n=1 Tax=Solitalea koreensis TaxID=543615 RepID=A0A521DJH2_9SPHI|nr:ROK family protein [Solitalea koreensis]SMO71732.1 Mannose-6-phosphate isomerase, class I [Solitalea koreensis]